MCLFDIISSAERLVRNTLRAEMRAAAAEHRRAAERYRAAISRLEEAEREFKSARAVERDCFNRVEQSYRMLLGREPGVAAHPGTAGSDQ